MPIDRIYISGHREDYRFTRCLVTSIRQFYPEIPISLIKDEINGAYSTSELEDLFRVEVFDTPVKRFGWGMAKLEPLFLEGRERCLILDSDIVFLGPLLEKLDAVEADFVVEECEHDPGDVLENYFDIVALKSQIPAFRYPGYVFNSGQLVARTGLLRREDFMPFLRFDEPRVPLRKDLFAPGDQGILNFVLFDKQQHGELSLARFDFMKWPPAVKPDSIRIDQLNGPGYPYLLHWAGHKQPSLAANPLGEVLQYFEVQYHRRRAGHRTAGYAKS